MVQQVLEVGDGDTHVGALTEELVEYGSISSLLLNVDEICYRYRAGR